MAYKLALFSAEVLDPGNGRGAIMIRQAGGKRTWLPKSQIRRMEPVDGAVYRLVIPKWLADQKQITDYHVG